mmetsp:Transcript_19885/g.30627  ORF Transcript_19885/g.30627 Transcript_19885/m.30627 type:complete len:85 (+) Transcript_19885:4122-4376(+)
MKSQFTGSGKSLQNHLSNTKLNRKKSESIDFNAQSNNNRMLTAGQQNSGKAPVKMMTQLDGIYQEKNMMQSQVNFANNNNSIQI